VPFSSFNPEFALGARFLFLLNLAGLFFLKGGRTPAGLTLYHVLSLAAFLILQINPGLKNFPKNNIFWFLLTLLTAWSLSTLIDWPGPRGLEHGSTMAIHALNFFTAILLCDSDFSRRILKMVLMGSGLMAAPILAKEILPFNFHSTLLLPNTNLEADFMNCGLLILAAFLTSLGDPLKRKAAITIFILLFSGYVFLFSRGAFLALLSGLTVLFASDWKRAARVFLYSLVLFLLFFNVPRIRDSWASKIGVPGDRVTVWKGALKAWKQRPLLGWGLGGFERAYKIHRVPMESDIGRYEKTTAFAHNEYLQIAVETGLLGLLAWLAFIFALMKKGFATARRDPSKWETTAALACLVMFLAHAAIDFNLHLPIIGFLFSIFAALLIKEQSPQEAIGFGKKGLIPILSLWLLASLYALLSLGQKETARAVRLNPFSRELLEKLIRLPDTDENFSAARSALPWHLKEDRIFAYLARSYFKRAQMEESEAAYQKAIENNPKNPFYLTELADLYLGQKKLREAFPLYLRALELEPFYLHPRAQMANILAVGGKKEEAFAALQDIRKIQEKKLPANSEYTQRLLNRL